MNHVVSRSGAHPERVSRFEILELLGEGAMGVVYRARDPVLERDVALKLIRPETAGEAKSRARFLRECRAAATINHPNVATIYEAGETDDGLLYLASELVVGETLKDRLLTGPLPLEEVVDLGIQLAEALDAAHRKGAVHRDIKPSNLMVDELGRLKVLDFGLARLGIAEESEGAGGTGNEAVDMTQDGAVVGTPAYMSPEQASAMAVDGRTDIFSAGCVLHELVTGRSPFHAGSVPKTLRRVICEEPTPLGSSVGDEFAGLDEVLQRAMAKDRELRMATGRELADALGELARDQDAELSGAGAQVARSRRRTLMIGSATMLLALMTLTLFLWQWSRPSLAFTDHDRIIVADVVNTTGDQAFDLALRTALETDLKQSPYARLYRRHQVDETLRLMRRAPDTFIDEELGRDICRFSGIRALIVPRVERIDDGYRLEVLVIDPQTGRRVEQFPVTARTRDEVLVDAIDELTRELRTRLGESLESIEKNDFPIAEVTTSSWEAMHHFAMANVNWGRGKVDEAIRLYELALGLDPAFATCRGSLGLLLIQFGGDPERGAEELRRALVDGATLPRDEYLMLRAANRQFADRDLEGALEEYRVVTELYPRHGAAHNNMGRILLQLGRYEEAAAMFERAAEIDPHGTVPLVNLAFLHVTVLPDPAAAEAICRRLVAIDDEVANYHSLLGWSVAVQGRYNEARQILERAVELDPDHPFALPNLGYVLLAAGNPESAVIHFRRNLARIRQAGENHNEFGGILDLAVGLAEAGDRPEVERLVEEGERRLEEMRGGGPMTLDNHAFLAQLYAAAGRTADAEAQFGIAASLKADDPDLRFELARTCAMLGRRDCAIDNTRLALEQGLRDPYLPMLIPSMNSLLGDPEFMAIFDYRREPESGHAS